MTTINGRPANIRELTIRSAEVGPVHLRPVSVDSFEVLEILMSDRTKQADPAAVAAAANALRGIADPALEVTVRWVDARSTAGRRPVDLYVATLVPQGQAPAAKGYWDLEGFAPTADLAVTMLGDAVRTKLVERVQGLRVQALELEKFLPDAGEDLADKAKRLELALEEVRLALVCEPDEDAATVARHLRRLVRGSRYFGPNLPIRELEDTADATAQKELRAVEDLLRDSLRGENGATWDAGEWPELCQGVQEALDRYRGAAGNARELLALARGRRQFQVYTWAIQTFGEWCGSPHERALRFLEEALELAQAAGLTQDDVARLVGHVFGRPLGEVPTELGQVTVTLLALAESFGQSLEALERAEVLRLLESDPRELRARHARKVEAGITSRHTSAKWTEPRE